MTLERYVLLENGMVVDLANRELTRIFEEDGEVCSMSRKIGDEWPDRLLPECYDSVPVSTSPDIWGLVKDGWLYGLQTKDHLPTCLTVASLCENDAPDYPGRATVISRCGWHTPRENVNSLFAPIVDNGKVVRYELVWEK